MLIRSCNINILFKHILWECPQIHEYWSKVHDILSEVTETPLQLEARRCLLNIWEPTDLNTAQTLWVTLGLTIAKRNIAQKWGAAQAPTIESWKTDLDWCMYREKSTCVSRGCPQKWVRVWTQWSDCQGGILRPPVRIGLEELSSP